MKGIQGGTSLVYGQLITKAEGRSHPGVRRKLKSLELQVSMRHREAGSKCQDTFSSGTNALDFAHTPSIVFHGCGWRLHATARGMKENHAPGVPVWVFIPQSIIHVASEVTDPFSSL